MKRGTINILLMLCVICLCITCQKTEYRLGSVPDKSTIDFEVLQDFDTDEGGNTVILRNKTPSTIPYWNYGTGTSTRQQDTIHFAFAGDYTIKLSSLTAGGIVEVDSVVVKVTQNNLNYVSDPLWIALSGGPGNEKTWILDIDQHFFDGPLYFYGTDNGWLSGGDNGCYGTDCWNWSPDYPGNTWLMPYGDYGTMTFSLISSPIVTVEHLMIPGRQAENGTYNINVANKRLSLSNANILHDFDRENCAANWGELQLFSLDENTMQLGVMRRASCDGEAYLVYNFVTKEFADSNAQD